MTDTIIIGSQPVPRTVVGAISRLELIAAQHGREAMDDIRFLRDRFNALENVRDELRDQLASMTNEVQS